MIIAGTCLLTSNNELEIIEVIETAKQLREIADIFRCKIFGGGTTPEKYKKGIGYEGLYILTKIEEDIMPVATEIQTETQLNICNENLSYIWIGARNSQNYGLLEVLRNCKPKILMKRGFGMSVKETIGLYDIMRDIIKKDIILIERGIMTFDRTEQSRWSADLKGVIQIKNDRPDIFSNLMVDCSHSTFNKNYIEDTYKAFKSIGINHFMFECSANPEKAKADKEHCLSVKELKNILNKE